MVNISWERIRYLNDDVVRLSDGTLAGSAAIGSHCEYLASIWSQRPEQHDKYKIRILAWLGQSGAIAAGTCLIL